MSPSCDLSQAVAASYLWKKIRERDWAWAFLARGAASDNWFGLKLISKCKCSAKQVMALVPHPVVLLETYIPPFAPHIAFVFVLVFSVEVAGASFWTWMVVWLKKTTRSERWEKCLKLFRPEWTAPFWRRKIKVCWECWWKERDCPVYWSWYDSWCQVGMCYVHWISTCDGK